MGCRQSEASAKKQSGRLPTLSGFCAFMSCGLRAYAALEERYPEAGDLLSAVFEDEALNASPSPALLAAYLKRRLGYDEEQDDSEIEAECGSLRLVFEHDIEEDGE